MSLPSAALRTATGRTATGRTATGRTAAGGTATSRVAASRAALTVVPPASWRPRRTPFVLLSLLVVGIGLLGLLGLNTVLAEDAFRRYDLERQAALLSEQEQQLASEVAALEAPEQLAARAAELGLVPAGPPAFLRLSDGAVLGAPFATAAVAPVAPAEPVASATAEPAPRAKPSASAQPATARPIQSPKAR